MLPGAGDVRTYRGVQSQPNFTELSASMVSIAM